MDQFFQQFARWFILLGLSIAGLGLLLILVPKLGQFRIPGDMVFGGRNWRLYLPIGTCLLASAILTLILWIINLFRR